MKHLLILTLLFAPLVTLHGADRKPNVVLILIDDFGYSKNEYGPDIVSDYALDFITRKKDVPFFLYYPMMLTHAPYDATPDSPDYIDSKTTKRKGKGTSGHFPDVPEQATAAWKEMADWMKHSRESVIGAGPGPFPEAVNAPVTTGKGVAYVHLLPGFKDEVIWKDAPRPARALLLRSQEPVSFQYEHGTLRLTVPASARTQNDDVVKVILAD
jgi:hypothetical protein